MTFNDLIHQRRSIRDYDPGQKIPSKVLNNILEAGRVAPSAANRQPWRFIIIQTAEKLDAVKASYQRPWFNDAPCILAVVGNPTLSWIRPTDSYNSIETDLTIAMDHMILAATAEGVGTCWIIAFDEPVLRSALDLSADEVVFAITPLGYPHQGYQPKPGPNRKPLKEVVSYL